MTTRTLKGWIEKSHKISGLKENSFLMYDFQSLGKLEYQLSQEWEEMKNNFDDLENITAFDNHSILSRLWVMAGYEFLREVKKYDKRSEVKEAHKLFERVRIPIVKYDVPKNFYSKASVYPADFGAAYLALSQNAQDIGWAVASDTFISRDELANTLFKLY